jgi:type IV secretion system protein TrbE
MPSMPAQFPRTPPRHRPSRWASSRAVRPLQCSGLSEAGQYGFLFDNAEDTLSFSQFQTFNFTGWGDAPEVLEPLLFYVLHRASNEIADPKKLATFKMFLLDEAWLFIKNETIRNYIVSAQKTWRKHNAAMILATQSIKELEESGMLQIVSESCPTKIFLANPEMDRGLYRAAFHLNDTELDLIAGLVPPGQMLIRKAQTSNKVQLNVDSVSHWTATNNSRDNLKKRDYFERFGIADGLRRLAQDYPPASAPSRAHRTYPEQTESEISGGVWDTWPSGLCESDASDEGMCKHSGRW